MPRFGEGAVADPHVPMRCLAGDLWGPLVLCLLLSIILSFNAPDDQKALVFAAVFVIVWLGSAIVTVNALLLGGNLSFFQTSEKSLLSANPDFLIGKFMMFNVFFVQKRRIFSLRVLCSLWLSKVFALFCKK